MVFNDGLSLCVGVYPSPTGLKQTYPWHVLGQWRLQRPSVRPVWALWNQEWQLATYMWPGEWERKPLLFFKLFHFGSVLVNICDLSEVYLIFVNYTYLMFWTIVLNNISDSLHNFEKKLMNWSGSWILTETIVAVNCITYWIRFVAPLWPVVWLMCIVSLTRL